MQKKYRKPSYLVPSVIILKIMKYFKQYKIAYFGDFKEFCIKQHPELNTIQSKKCLYEIFHDLDNISNGWLDYDHFLIAYAFAFKEAQMITTHFV